MSVTMLLAFWAVSILFVITPGADWAYAITAGLRNSSVLPAVAGMLAGHLLATLVVAAGVGSLVARAPAVLTVLTVVGAAYLAWIGIGLMRQPTVPHAGKEPVTTSWMRQAAKGLGVSGLNPKVFLLFLALLPQFTDPDADWSIGLQLVALGLLHVTSCAVVYVAVSLGARHVLRTRPAAARVVIRASGVLMIVVALVLIGEQMAA